MARIALITGATSGIGREFYNLLRDDPSYDELWVTGRNTSALAELEGPNTETIPADLTQDGDIDRIINMIEERKATVSLLINCAGLGFRSLFEEQSASMVATTIDVNCRALSVLCSRCLPYMENGSSRIINIASSSGFLPQPTFTVYAATKAYVISFSRALGEELRSRKIPVTVVCPGPVVTDFQARATEGRDTEFTGIRKSIAARPEDVARASLKVSRRGRSLFVYGFLQKLLHITTKIIPLGWILRIIKW